MFNAPIVSSSYWRGYIVSKTRVEAFAKRCVRFTVRQDLLSGIAIIALHTDLINDL